MTDKTKRQLRAEEMANAIPKVLDALVGSTGCHADTTLDNESQANIPKLQAVAEWLLDRLQWANKSIDSPYLSAKNVARNVIDSCDGLDDFFIDTKHILINCPHCYTQYSIRMWNDKKPKLCVSCGKEIDYEEI